MVITLCRINSSWGPIKARAGPVNTHRVVTIMSGHKATVTIVTHRHVMNDVVEWGCETYSHMTELKCKWAWQKKPNHSGKFRSSFLDPFDSETPVSLYFVLFERTSCSASRFTPDGNQLAIGGCKCTDGKLEVYWNRSRLGELWLASCIILTLLLLFYKWVCDFLETNASLLFMKAVRHNISIQLYWSQREFGTF